MNDTNAVSCEGGCACGDVRFRANNRPRRTGLCHCMTCRKAHGATFNPFAVYLRDEFQFSGEVRSWESSPGYLRWFCPRCGSRVFDTSKDEIEISMGSLDEINAFTPEYEVWVIRREAWQPPLAIPQFAQDRQP